MQSHLPCADTYFYLLQLFYPKSNHTWVYSTLCPLYLLLQQLCFKIPLAQWGAYKSSALQVFHYVHSDVSLYPFSCCLPLLSWVHWSFESGNSSSTCLYSDVSKTTIAKGKRKQVCQMSSLSSFANIHRACVFTIFLTNKTELVYFPFKQSSDEPQLQNTQHWQNTLGGLELDRAKMCWTL